ncbi:MAG TPA: hypothetical protein VFN23_10685 [Ktedonobacteraceae bacterium]|nr:hypothetical protein [Ktedonobacteraceae bacterium]
MFFDRIRYEIRLMGRKVLLTPILVMLGVGLFSLLLKYINTEPSRFLSAGLEMMIPIGAGIIIGTVAPLDPSLELQLTFPRKYYRTAMARIVLILLCSAGVALLSSGILLALKLDFVPVVEPHWPAFAQFVLGLLVWLAPLLWCAGACLCISLLLRSRTAGAAVLAALWIGEILFKDTLIATHWLWPIYLFPVTLTPLGAETLPANLIADWFTNRYELLGTALVFFLLGWWMLHNTEGLLKGASEE